MKNRRVFALSMLLLVVGMFVFTGCSDDDDDDNTILGDSGKTTIEIAAIIPFTGDYGHHGTLFLSAVQCAIEDANAELEAVGNNSEFRLIYGDSMTDGYAANVLMKSYGMQGIRAVVGPFTSGEVAGASETVATSNCFLISPSATMTTLAGPDDHIFRMVNDDRRMAEVLAGRMIDDGITHLLVLYRDDLWGNSASSAIADAFTAKGGTIVYEWDVFAQNHEYYNIVLEDLATVLASKQETIAAENIAVHMTSYEEGSDIFELASEIDILKSVRWYGSDGFVNDSTLVATPDAAEFATRLIILRRSTVLIWQTRPTPFRRVSPRKQVRHRACSRCLPMTPCVLPRKRSQKLVQMPNTRHLKAPYFLPLRNTRVLPDR